MIARYIPEALRDKPTDPKPALPKPALTLANMQHDKLIVRDEVWPGMYRVRMNDGSLSGRFNLTRARDVARALLYNAGTGK